MRFSGLFTSLMLGISMTSTSFANPLDGSAELQDRSAELQDRSSVLEERGLTLKVIRGPTKDATCPHRERVGNFGPYARHKYTENQIKAAFRHGAQLAAAGKQVGDRKYPHDFRNAEGLPFHCGKNKMEFPITINNRVYNGGPSDNIPDRVVFGYKKTKKEFQVTYCGVMRHGPRRDFLLCP
ncbi:hypothetical protein E4U42_007357 [Claviceps africana]|uniref:Uncharacterized protein n=1 Tax=Claviceps africana TaxID=83212 RepID=A0A8K0J188_9HYPO|nr:hypothetical protein E4U42_007357 [Claviceps africana]